MPRAGADAPSVLPTSWFDCVAFDTNHLPFILWRAENTAVGGGECAGVEGGVGS